MHTKGVSIGQKDHELSISEGELSREANCWYNLKESETSGHK